MCGILGYRNYRNGREIDRETFSRLIDTLAHRGPDDKGIYQARGTGLGHRRLSIIDLTPGGKQPMGSPDQKVWLVYNGEIYNFKTIREKLGKLGHKFVSTSDTEVLLHAYLEWDLNCLARLNGIFAFGLWDERRHRLWLVRDQIGVKPLYFADYQGTLYFASEIQTLLAIPEIPRTIDPEGIDAYFTFSYVPAPYTGYKHIKQVLPGHYLLLEGEAQKSAQYWDLPLDSPKINLDEPQCIQEFDRLFTETVQRQMVSDVPLGAFLSSGTDSFAVARAMRQTGSGEVTAFSIGFSDKRFDELDNTRLAAAALGVKLVAERLQVDFRHLLEKIAPHCEDPFADSSCLPMYLLCSIASKHVKVALSGDGGDELLAGYQVYKANRYARVFRKLPDFVKHGLVQPLADLIPDVGGKYTHREKLRRFIYGAGQGAGRDHASWRVIIPQELKQRIYTPEFRSAVKDFDPLSLYTQFITSAKDKGCSDLESYLYADLRFYLPNDMLVKVDRMSMAHGLEVRVPFLDLELVNFCWRLPDHLKIAGGQLKYILRQTIKDLYPPILQKLPKSGFNMSPYDNFIPDRDFVNQFGNFSALHKNDLFSNYSYFLIKYSLFMIDHITKKYKLTL